jgi:hypothetical protein
MQQSGIPILIGGGGRKRQIAKSAPIFVEFVRQLGGNGTTPTVGTCVVVCFYKTRLVIFRRATSGYMFILFTIRMGGRSIGMRIHFIYKWRLIELFV